MTPEQTREFYIDVKDVANSEAGRRFLDWWRRRVTSTIDPDRPNTSHFMMARRVDFDVVDRIIRIDLDVLLAELVESMERHLPSTKPADDYFREALSHDESEHERYTDRA